MPLAARRVRVLGFGLIRYFFDDDVERCLCYFVASLVSLRIVTPTSPAMHINQDLEGLMAKMTIDTPQFERFTVIYRFDDVRRFYCQMTAELRCHSILRAEGGAGTRWIVYFWSFSCRAIVWFQCFWFYTLHQYKFSLDYPCMSILGRFIFLTFLNKI